MNQTTKTFTSKTIVLLCALLMSAIKLYTQTITCNLQPMSPVVVCVNGCAIVTNTTFQVPGDTTCFPGWFWTMPGGTPSTFNYFQPGCITYATTGTFVVTLFAVDSNGDTTSANSMSTTVTVTGPPSASFTVQSNPVCINDILNATADNPSLFTTAVYDWDMGDGNIYFNNGPTVSHTYSNPGTYTVNLCVTDSCGTDCFSQIVTVLSPQPRFSWEGTCRIYFTSDTTCPGQIISHFWDFGDPASGPSNSSTLPNPIHTFTQNNVMYTVTHTIVTFNGTFTYSTQVIQSGPPQPVISGYQTNNCGTGFMTYTATPCNPGVVYIWNVIGGSPATTTGCQTNINWNSSGGYIILSAWDSIADCFGYDTMRIPACCDDLVSTTVRINNTTASAVLLQYSQYVTGNNFTTNNEIIINGVFTIDVPFSFVNCANVNFGANALTYVNPGQTLTYDNTRVLGKCDTMWDGNHISNVTATLNIINGSIIQQAKRAVYSISGGNYYIENSTLRNNYKDIVVEAYSGTHPGVVRNTNFTMVGVFLPAIPALPPGHTKTVCGIEIKDNADITIGDPTIATYLNNFTNILVGVRSENSITTVTNCRFANLNPTFAQLVNVPDAGTGIVAIGGKNTLYQPSLTVGGIGLNRCVVIDARIGIDVRERTTVSVVNNNITNVRVYGVRVQRSSQVQVTVADNTIWNQTGGFGFNTAILILECYDATANILRNRIMQTTNVNAQVGTGIRVGLVSPGDMIVNIVGNNSINRVKTGVWLQNLVGKNKVFVGGNVVTFSKPNSQYTTVHYGIRLEGCATVRCDTNRVTKTSSLNPTSAMVQNLRGISIENSPVTVVSDNVFTKMGSGIFGWEISSASTLACNTMDRCYNGVFFTGGAATNGNCDIGDQIVDPMFTPSATGNTWTNNVSIPDEIRGDVSPLIVWRYQTTTPTFVNTSGITMQQVGYNACNFFFLAPQQFERDQQVGAALRSAADTNTTADNRYQLRRYAHRKLTQTPTWMSLGFQDDTLYQNFYSSYNPTNVGVLRQIEIAADTGGYQFVINACSALTCSNSIEHNAKVVYAIYAATWMQDIMEFTPADSATLLNIATQDPVEGGTAVYSARVMLDLEIDYYGASSQRIGQESTNSATQSELKVYPNPASESVKLEFGVEEGQNAQVQIFDLSGKLVLSQQLVPQQEVYAIETGVLLEGVYMLRVIVEGEAKESQRLVIVK